MVAKDLPEGWEEKVEDYRRSINRGFSSPEYRAAAKTVSPIFSAVNRAIFANPKRFIASNLRRSQLGIHWSHDPHSSALFGARENPRRITLHLRAEVDPQHVIRHGSVEWSDYKWLHGLFDNRSTGLWIWL